MLTAFLGVYPLTAAAQTITTADSTRIYRKSKHIPFWVKKNTTSIALHLTKNYSDDQRKTLALSYWISRNISYDYKAFITGNFDFVPSRSVIRRRQALCGGYSRLFQEMGNVVGLQSDVVLGYTKRFDFFDGDTLYRAEHAWSVVKINGAWTLMDLTWASGYIVRRKQLIRKLLWVYFNKDYDPKYKWVQRLGPKWLNVSPKEMVYTHLPVISYHQLLQNPVSITDFEGGNEKIDQHLLRNPGINNTNSHVDRFLAKDQIQRWEEESVSFTNPNNHRLQAFYRLMIADSLYRKVYFNDPHALEVSDEALVSIIAHADTADSLVTLFKADTEAEYRSRERRSLKWKHQLRSSNNTHRNNLKTRYSENKRQIRTLRKINRKNRSIQRYAAHKQTQYKSERIVRVRRPGKESLADTLLSKRLLFQADSMNQEGLLTLTSVDSMPRPFHKGRADSVTRNQQMIARIHNQNRRFNYIEYRRRKWSMPFIYRDSLPLSKHYFRVQHALADTLNRRITAPFIFSLYDTHVALYDSIKQYASLTGKQLRLIENAKKKSMQNRDEDSIYAQLINRFQNDMERSRKTADTLSLSTSSLEATMKRELRKMRKSRKWLYKDNIIENIRHARYMRYRKRIRKRENFRAKVMRGRIKKAVLFAKRARAKRERRLTLINKKR